MKQQNENKIKWFIIENNPRYKDLQRFIITKVTKRCTEKKYDKDPNVYKGNYCTGLQTFKLNGHIEVINGHYKMTSWGILNIHESMYTTAPHIIIARLGKRIEGYKQCIKRRDLEIESISCVLKCRNDTINDFQKSIRKFLNS